MSIDPKRAKTARGKRALEKMMPKINENPRTALVVRGQKTSAIINSALTDLFVLKKPFARHFTRHNAVHPFEDATPLEFLCQKNDASLFAFGTHSKKRPHNLVIGRLFDHRILDMYELGVDSFKGMAEFAADIKGGTTTDCKPCLLFSGDQWEHDAALSDLRQVLLDFFHQQVVEQIGSLGIEQVISFTAMPGRKVFVRTYMARLLKSAETTAPHVDLREMGPSLDLTVRRTHAAQPDILKQAMIRPKAEAAKPKKVKNVERSKLLGKQGRLHMPKQDLNQMATARFKATRKARGGDGDGGEGGGGGGGAKRPKSAGSDGPPRKKARK